MKREQGNPLAPLHRPFIQALIASMLVTRIVTTHRKEPTMKSILKIALIALALTVPGSLFAATAPVGTAVRQDIPADLAKQAKVSLEAAQHTALARVPRSEVRSVELEKEGGKLIYSFDLVVPGKSGVEEVAVSAITGKVVAKHHESARDERREKEQEKKEHHPPAGH